MSLSPSKAAELLLQAIAEYAYMNSEGEPEYDEDGNLLIHQNTLNISDYAHDFSVAYHDYASDGEVLGAESGDGDKSILYEMIIQCAEYGSVDEGVITIIAEGFADYWSTACVTPGEPAHGGVSVVSISNDSSSKVSEYYSAIVNSYRDEYETPFYLHFISNVESVVKQVIWKVTELMSDGSTQTFNENIT